MSSSLESASNPFAINLQVDSDIADYVISDLDSNKNQVNLSPIKNLNELVDCLNIGQTNESL